MIFFLNIVLFFICIARRSNGTFYILFNLIILPQYLSLDTNYISQAAKDIIRSRTFYQYFFQKQYIDQVRSINYSVYGHFRGHIYVLKNTRGKVVFLYVVFLLGVKHPLKTEFKSQYIRNLSKEDKLFRQNIIF